MSDTRGNSILVIEDDGDLAFALVDNLEAQSYRVTHETDGEAGLTRALEERFDLIVLDIMLPKLDGFAICRELRRRVRDTPILVISARGEESDKVRGLDLGADDYLPKPFGLEEFLARVRAQLRRSSAAEVFHTLRLGDRTIDLNAQQVSHDGETRPLTHHECELLRHLAEHRGSVVSRKELLREVWGLDPQYGDRTVDHHVVKLRRKLEPDPRQPRYLLTVYGEGYRLAE